MHISLSRDDRLAVIIDGAGKVTLDDTVINQSDICSQFYIEVLFPFIYFADGLTPKVSYSVK